MSYATGSDLVARYDIDLVGDLATDDRDTLDRDGDASLVTSHVNVSTALDDASAEIDAALLAGGRYTPEQLAGLTGNALEHLKRITCAIAITMLFDRRPESISDNTKERAYTRAKELLKSLQSGDNIFGLPEEIDAGIVDVGGPDVVDIEQRNDLTSRMSRYFPEAQTRLPTNRG